MILLNGQYFKAQQQDHAILYVQGRIEGARTDVQSHDSSSAVLHLCQSWDPLWSALESADIQLCSSVCEIGST